MIYHCNKSQQLHTCELKVGDIIYPQHVPSWNKCEYFILVENQNYQKHPHTFPQIWRVLKDSSFVEEICLWADSSFMEA